MFLNFLLLEKWVLDLFSGAGYSRKYGTLFAPLHLHCKIMYPFGRLVYTVISIYD
jgi:hypothetical protein